MSVVNTSVVMIHYKGTQENTSEKSYNYKIDDKEARQTRTRVSTRQDNVRMSLIFGNVSGLSGYSGKKGQKRRKIRILWNVSGFMSGY